jgi:uncharacterized damage-inducible protein DinB
MKDLLIAFAAYNRDANAALRAILGKTPASVLGEDQGVYYKTILGTFEHVVGAEVNWLKRFGGYFEYPSLAKSPLIAADIAETKRRIAADSAALFAVSAEADELFVAFASELKESQFGVRVGYKNAKGEEVERVYWNCIFHILNHGTHHRGEISALLDRKGVENDVSGFNKYTK